MKDAMETLYRPVESIVKTLAGPAAEEFGLMLRDSVRMYRFKRQIRLLKQFEKVCNNARITPQAVKFSLLFDILERASVEDDDELQDLWANLLANAADPQTRTIVGRAFPEILRQLSRQEALFLNAVYELVGEEHKSMSLPINNGSLPALNRIEQENLMRLGLLGRDTIMVNGQGGGTSLTPYAHEFVKACRAPKQRM